MTDKYYTLIGATRDSEQRWFWENLFGDFDSEIVVDEFETYRGSRTTEYPLLRVIETDGEQLSIDIRLAELDEEFFYLNKCS
tara:strand:+ start:227 stop:472 length:246 start_codon:yes stop_codon:yes gene_type:complete